jgi:hypothetical protein
LNPSGKSRCARSKKGKKATRKRVAEAIVHVQPRNLQETKRNKGSDVRRETTEVGRGAGQEIEHLPLLISEFHAHH